jgi:uncharacterized membrane protein YgdD (TMEM256/DUF423 family)
MLAEMADGPKRMENWKTATDYLFVHAGALMLLATFSRICPKFRLLASLLFLLGILLFSFGLYAWVRLDQRWLVMVVPVGGLAFVAGWVMTIAAVLFHKDTGSCQTSSGCNGPSACSSGGACGSEGAH